MSVGTDQQNREVDPPPGKPGGNDQFVSGRPMAATGQKLLSVSGPSSGRLRAVSRDRRQGPDANPTDPRVSPALAEDLSRLQPAIVVTAGFDPLRDEGEAHAAALQRADVRLAGYREPELIHGFINMTAIPAAHDAMVEPVNSGA